MLAVNTSSRMESNSLVNRIHCSERSAELLRMQDPNIPVTARGLINVKGKGEMLTFWVNDPEGATETSTRSISNRSSTRNVTKKN